MLKLKDGIDPKVLEKYGFELGQKFIDKGERCICNEALMSLKLQPSSFRTGEASLTDLTEFPFLLFKFC